nr:unnamed protein product [Callosobruchus chinensis]
MCFLFQRIQNCGRGGFQLYISKTSFLRRIAGSVIYILKKIIYYGNPHFTMKGRVSQLLPR